MLIGLLPFPSNSKIIAESWLDEYKNMFYALRPVARRIPLDHTYDEMQKLRRERQCHPFEWYLRHVNPELRSVHWKKNYIKNWVLTGNISRLTNR